MKRGREDGCIDEKGERRDVWIRRGREEGCMDKKGERGGMCG